MFLVTMNQAKFQETGVIFDIDKGAETPTTAAKNLNRSVK